MSLLRSYITPQILCHSWILCHSLDLTSLLRSYVTPQILRHSWVLRHSSDLTPLSDLPFCWSCFTQKTKQKKAQVQQWHKHVVSGPWGWWEGSTWFTNQPPLSDTESCMDIPDSGLMHHPLLNSLLFLTALDLWVVLLQLQETSQELIKPSSCSHPFFRIHPELCLFSILTFPVKNFPH